MKNLSIASIVAAVAAVLVLASVTSVDGFSVTSSRASTKGSGIGLFGSTGASSLLSDRVSYDSTTTLQSTADSTSSEDVFAKKKKTLKELRAEGGITTFNTPIGALNLFAMYYFFVSVALGIPWVIFCKCWQIVHWLSRGRFDPRRRLPIFIGHVWGMTLMRLTRCYPKIINRDIVTDYFKRNKGEEMKNAMFVANHCSWMDIPFLGAVMGWRNYKIVSKKELGAVPILGTAIYAGGHIQVDRNDRRSQVKTLKQGINYLKNDKFILATFPEGTRSKDGRMAEFKAGAFKMAHKAGAPVFPISITNADKVMPIGWMMCMKPAYGVSDVIVHPPIESKDKTEDELVEAVRQSMIDGLPEHQKPL